MILSDINLDIVLQSCLTKNLATISMAGIKSRTFCTNPIQLRHEISCNQTARKFFKVIFWAN